MQGAYGLRPPVAAHEDWWKTAFDSPAAERVLIHAQEPSGLVPSLGALCEWLHLEPGQTVLEIGCGHGELIVPFAKAGYKMIGLDDSAVQLARAKKRAEAAGVTCEWVQADMRECQVRQPVDGVYMA